VRKEPREGKGCLQPVADKFTFKRETRTVTGIADLKYDLVLWTKGKKTKLKSKSFKQT